MRLYKKQYKTTNLTCKKSIFKFINMNQNVTEIGGLLYFLTYISDYLPYTLIEIIGTLIGVTG